MAAPLRKNRAGLYLLLLLLFFLSSPTYPSEASTRMSFSQDNIKFRNINHENLVKIGQIWGISEDEQGFIWVSGARGVVRFDGLNAKLFQNDINNPKSIPEGYIADILHTKSGRVWFCTTKGLFEFNPEKEEFIKFPIYVKGVEVTTFWAVDEHPDGGLWVGYSGEGMGRLDPDTGDFVHYLNPYEEIKNVELQNVYDLIVDDNGNIWWGNEGGLSFYNTANGEFAFYKYNVDDSVSLTPGTVTSILEDDEQHIWVGTMEGLNRLEPVTGKIHRYYNNPQDDHSISGNIIGDIDVDMDGRVWISVDGGGLNLYQPDQDNFLQIKSNANRLGSLKNDSVRRAFVSSAGDLWVGYHPYGIGVTDRYGAAFQTFTHDPTDSNSISSNTIYALHQPTDKDLWVGTEKGINHIDLGTRKVTRYPYIPDEPNSLSATAVLTVYADSQNRVWAGTWSGGLNMYEPDKDKYTHFKHNPKDPRSIPSNNVWIVTEKDENHMWVGSSSGLSLLNVKEGSFAKVANINHRVGNMVQYGDKYLLCITDNGIFVVNSQTLKMEPPNKGWASLPKIVNAYISKDGAIWINTEKGFVKQDSLYGSITYFYSAGEKAKLYYSQIVVDNNGTAWFGNSAGITSFEESTQRFVTFNSNHGLPGDSFRVLRAAKLLRDGRVAMGGADGIAIFKPEDTERVGDSVQPVFLGLKVLDQKVDINSSESPLNKVMNLADKITLSYEQNVFSIEYSSLDFQLASSNQFKFRLIGFDHDWRFVGSQRVATYTNMDPGRYTFELMVSNDQGFWSDKVSSVEIDVLPPWWLTWWAYALYGFVAITFASLILYGIWLNSQRSHERRVNSKLKEIDRLKDEFMAKTSHELRTPLNGIIGLTEGVIAGGCGPISRNVQDKLKIVVSSGKRLSNIINDILDFSKLRNHAISLNISKVRLLDLVGSVVSLSEPLVGNKEIKLVNNVPDDFPLVEGDEQRITQILFNLVGNAIKFTSRGKVIVSAFIKDDKVIINVSDSGVGIKKEDQARIFQPFEQSLGDRGNVHFGTGLGLAVSKQLVELHGGEIGLESSSGAGSTFYFSLPIKQANATSLEQMEGAKADGAEDLESSVKSKWFSRDKKEDVKKEGASTASSSDEKTKDKNRDDKTVQISEGRSLKSAVNNNGKKYRILIVDDEPVNRMVLIGFLGTLSAEIEECGSGIEALGLLSEGKQYDLILLDVMMPKMSGYEVCEKIRLSYSLKELPVIFLTAKSQLKDMERGYDSGANDFLYKPVVREEFIAKVKMQLQLYDAIKSSPDNLTLPGQSTAS